MLCYPSETNAGKTQLEFDVFKLLDMAPRVVRELPEGKKVVLDGVEYQAYNSVELAEIVKIEDDYNWFRRKFFPLAYAHAQAHLEMKALDNRLRLCVGDKGILESDRDYYRMRLDEFRLSAKNADRSARLEKIFLVSAVVLESVALVFTSVTLSVR